MASTAAHIDKRGASLMTKGKATPLKGWKGSTGFSTCVVTIPPRRDQQIPAKVKSGSIPTDPQQKALGVGQHPIVEPSQCCRIGNLIEMILQELDEEASQHGCFWCHIRLRACEHHVHYGLGSVKAGVGSVPKLHHRCL